MEAVKAKQEVLGKSALASGADPNQTDIDGSPLTHLCAQGNMLGLLDLMIKKGAHVAAKDRQGNTLVQKCVKNGWPQALRIVLQSTDSVNDTDEAGDTLMHTAVACCRKGAHYFECIGVLIKANAPTEMRNHRGETPAHHAARYGGPKAIQLLSGQVNFSSSRDLDGHYPIHAAVLAPDNDDSVRKLIELKVDLNVRDRDGRSALHLIAQKSKNRAADLQAAKLLIAAGANLWIQDRDGFTPYEHAVDALSQNRELYPELIRILRPSGQPPEGSVFTPEVKKGKKSK